MTHYIIPNVAILIVIGSGYTTKIFVVRYDIIQNLSVTTYYYLVFDKNFLKLCYPFHNQM